jgi:hypothetical protein
VSHGICAELRICEEKWAESKVALQFDKAFFSRWLELLTMLEAYVPYKPDTARKNMLGKLLADA